MIQPDGFPSLPADFEYDTEVHQSLGQERTIFMNVFRKKDCVPTRALLVVHGLGEHGGRYQHFAHYLHDQYDLILAVDLRGHGRSEGIRGHVNHFDEYIDDVLLAYDVLKKKISNGGIPDIFGHSMGGLILLRTLQKRPELGAAHIIISGPPIGSKVPVPALKELAGRFLAKVWGTFQMETGIEAKYISHDQAVVKAYQNDRLVHSKATPLFYFSMMDVMSDLIAKSVALPASAKLLLQLAAEDEIVNIETAKKFFEDLKLTDKKLIIYPGLYHEIYNEPTKENVFHDFIRFLQKSW